MIDSPSEKNVHHKALTQYSRISFLQAVVYRLPNICFFRQEAARAQLFLNQHVHPGACFATKMQIFFVSVCFAGEAPEAPQKRDVFAEFEALAGIQVSSARSSGECHC